MIKGKARAVFVIRRLAVLKCGLYIQKEHEGEGSVGLAR